MRRSLTLFLAAYWAFFFALLMANALSNLNGGPEFGFSGELGTNPFVSAIFAVAFGLTAILFAWLFAASLFENHDGGHAEEIGSIAFSGAAGLFCAGLIATALYPVSVPAVELSIHVAALAASYAAIGIDAIICGNRNEQSRNPHLQAPIRRMALTAAHTSLLSRISGRPDNQTERM